MAKPAGRTPEGRLNELHVPSPAVWSQRRSPSRADAVPTGTPQPWLLPPAPNGTLGGAVGLQPPVPPSPLVCEERAGSPSYLATATLQGRHEIGRHKI